MDDRQRLSGYVDVWWGSVRSFTDLLDDLADDDWRRPTDLPGWDVHACAAHTAHLEAVLAGEPEEAPIGGPDGRGLLADQHVHRAGRGRPPGPDPRRADQRDPARAPRRGTPRLLADPPTDGRAKPARHLQRRRLGLADPAAQPSAGRLDARAGRPTSRRPTRRPRLAGRRARGRLPLGVAGLRARQAGRGARGHHARARVSTATTRWPSRSTSRAADAAWTTSPPTPRSGWPWTASPSSWRPVAGASPVSGRDRRRRAGATGAGPLGRHPVTHGPHRDRDRRPVRTVGGIGLLRRPRAGPRWTSRGARRPYAGTTRRRLRRDPARGPRRRPGATRGRRVRARLGALGRRTGRRPRAGVAAGQQRGRDGHAVLAAPATGSTSRWRPTTGAPSCSPGCCSPSWSRAATAAWSPSRASVTAWPGTRRCTTRAASRGCYSRWAVYGQTKLANLLFTFELDRRLAAAGLPVKALAAHPGLAGTHLFANGQVGRAERRGSARSTSRPSAWSPSPRPTAPCPC